MDAVQLVTAALVAHVQLSCGAAPVVLDPGVGASALSAAVGEPSWEGDPCDTQPILHLNLPVADGVRRLTVRPRLEAQQRRMTDVTVAVQRGPLRLETAGTLLHDAVIGQTVKVRNDAARTTLSGVLVAPHHVEVP